MHKKLSHHFKEDIRAILFSAAIALILTSLGMLDVLTKMSLLAVANMASYHYGTSPNPESREEQMTGEKMVRIDEKEITIVYLSEGRWLGLYEGRSPLPREKFADDLKSLIDSIDSTPKTLVIDFDLSPVLDEENSAGQKELDRLLKEKAKILVLMAPMRVTNGDQFSTRLFETKLAWMRCQCAAGVVFGDSRHEVSMGTVVHYRRNDHNALASVARDRFGSTICKEINDADGAKRWLTTRAESQSNPPEEIEASAIDFARYVRLARLVPIGYDLDASATAGLGNNGDGKDDVFRKPIGFLSGIRIKNQTVFFGGAYGAGKIDNFLTPIGILPGVDVHASKFLSLSNKEISEKHWLEFLIDVLTGFIFSLFIAQFWRQYAVYKIKTIGYQRELSSGMVSLLSIAYVALVLVFSLLAADLFDAGILIAPLVIAASMLVHGFMIGPIVETMKVAGLPKRRNIRACSFLSLVTALVLTFLAAGVFHTSSYLWPALGLAVLALLTDRFLSTLLSPREGSHISQSRQASSAVSALCLVLTFVMMTANHINDWLPFSSILNAAVFASIVFISLMLLGGLLLDFPGELHLRPKSNRKVWSPAFQAFGVRFRPKSFLDKVGLSIALLRETLFWWAIAYAAFLIWPHS